jgi:hypothetical protein
VRLAKGGRETECLARLIGVEGDRRKRGEVGEMGTYPAAG